MKKSDWVRILLVFALFGGALMVPSVINTAQGQGGLVQPCPCPHIQTDVYQILYNGTLYDYAYVDEHRAPDIGDRVELDPSQVQALIGTAISMWRVTVIEQFRGTADGSLGSVKVRLETF